MIRLCFSNACVRVRSKTYLGARVRLWLLSLASLTRPRALMLVLRLHRSFAHAVVTVVNCSEINACTCLQVNGFFELSSNRRDIWKGNDMDGDGRTRSQWNEALIRDVIAPSFVRCVEALAQKWGPCARYYDTWPRAVIEPPWSFAQACFYELIATRPVLWTEASRRWVCPTDAVLMCEREDADAAVEIAAAGAPAGEVCHRVSFGFVFLLGTHNMYAVVFEHSAFVNSLC